MDKTESRKRPRSVTLSRIAVVLGALVVLVAVRELAPATTSGPGTPLLFDDFEYVAKSASTTERIGAKSAPTGQTFLILEVTLNNMAKRVDYTFDPSVVTPITTDGKVLQPDKVAQDYFDTIAGALGNKVKTILPAGSSETYRLVYLAPKGVESIDVQFRFGQLGTMLDNLMLGKRQVRLSVSAIDLQR
jgi:Domain of unknown function (DUF4352)